ncbi:protein SICKLE isoform X2 [Cornus florida]|uniref:protein SICKLE isoform X2 n=1 Tax=Cornus florida TaxID=4283 RepID=UPI0028A01A79|nr:protein SICKLE isoform X2 [Cornus florida]
MEESVKRRERLKAMRMESSQAGSYNEVDDSAISHNLSNPLIETSVTPPVQHAAPRFDYYTDPMAAFSSDKRSKVSNQISPQHIRPPTGPRNPEMTPSAAHQVQTNYSLDQRMYPARSPHHRSGPYRSPMATPSPAHQSQTNYPPDQRMYQARSPHHSYGPYRSPMATPSPAHQAQTNYPPDQRMYQARSPHLSSDPYISPMGITSPFGAHQGTPSGVWNGSGATSSYGFPYNSPRGGNFPSTGPGQGGSPSFNSGQGRGLLYDSPRGGNFPSTVPGQGGSPNFHSGQGRGHWFSNSPSPGSGHGACSSPNTGRGKGRWSGSGMSPGSGRSGGRGFRSRNKAELRPDLYYNKSMVEDPWEFLEPVPWKTPDSQESWLPKSISVKKPRVSEASNHHSSQPSLAEYLAASFNEAANHKPKTDEPSV